MIHHDTCMYWETGAPALSSPTTLPRESPAKHPFPFHLDFCFLYFSSFLSVLYRAKLPQLPKVAAAWPEPHLGSNDAETALPNKRRYRSIFPPPPLPGCGTRHQGQGRREENGNQKEAGEKETPAGHKERRPGGQMKKEYTP